MEVGFTVGKALGDAFGVTEGAIGLIVGTAPGMAVEGTVGEIVGIELGLIVN